MGRQRMTTTLPAVSLVAVLLALLPVLRLLGGHANLSGLVVQAFVPTASTSASQHQKWQPHTPFAMLGGRGQPLSVELEEMDQDPTTTITMALSMTQPPNHNQNSIQKFTTELTSTTKDTTPTNGYRDVLDDDEEERKRIHQLTMEVEKYLDWIQIRQEPKEHAGLPPNGSGSARSATSTLSSKGTFPAPSTTTTDVLLSKMTQLQARLMLQQGSETTATRYSEATNYYAPDTTNGDVVMLDGSTKHSLRSPSNDDYKPISKSYDEDNDEENDEEETNNQLVSLIQQLQNDLNFATANLEQAQDTITTLESIETDLLFAVTALEEASQQTKLTYQAEIDQLQHAKNYLQMALSDQTTILEELERQQAAARDVARDEEKKAASMLLQLQEKEEQERINAKVFQELSSEMAALERQLTLLQQEEAERSRAEAMARETAAASNIVNSTIQHEIRAQLDEAKESLETAESNMQLMSVLLQFKKLDALVYLEEDRNTALRTTTSLSDVVIGTDQLPASTTFNPGNNTIISAALPNANDGAAEERQQQQVLLLQQEHKKAMEQIQLEQASLLSIMIRLEAVSQYKAQMLQQTVEQVRTEAKQSQGTVQDLESQLAEARSELQDFVKRQQQEQEKAVVQQERESQVVAQTSKRIQALEQSLQAKDDLLKSSRITIQGLETKQKELSAQLATLDATALRAKLDLQRDMTQVQQKSEQKLQQQQQQQQKQFEKTLAERERAIDAAQRAKQAVEEKQQDLMQKVLKLEDTIRQDKQAKLQSQRALEEAQKELNQSQFRIKTLEKQVLTAQQAVTRITEQQQEQKQQQLLRAGKMDVVRSNILSFAFLSCNVFVSQL
jgi:hypothetical protein